MKSQCPLLKRYNYPQNLSLLEISEWYLSLCEDLCPIKKEGQCYYDWIDYKDILVQCRVTCPKCGAKDEWVVKLDDGVSCLHCGGVIYWTKPIVHERNKKL